MTIEPSKRRTLPPAPVHPLAALATIVLDNIFGVLEILDPFALLLTSLGVGLVGAFTTAMVQRHLAKDEWGPAVAKGLVMGVLAGVPFQVTGTAVGVPLLAWAGIHELVKLPAGRTPKAGPADPGDEIVDVTPKD